MSRRRGAREPEPGLFDLPLDGPVVEDEPTAREPKPPREQRPAPAQPPALPLDEPAPPRYAPSAVEPPAAEAAEEGGGEGRSVSLSARYLAGLADLAVHLALAVVLLFGARVLGVPADLGAVPALVVFLLIFSFLYTVVPLAFWGQTPGMAWAGVVARTPGDESLTFGQTALRWLGGVLTVLLLSLPVLPAAFTERSLADRLSGSVLRSV